MKFGELIEGAYTNETAYRCINCLAVDGEKKFVNEFYALIIMIGKQPILIGS